MENLIQSLRTEFAGYAPNLLAALAVLGVGWLFAYAVSAGLRALLSRTTLDNRLAKWVQGSGKELPIEDWIAKAVFWVLMLVVLVAFFQTLQLSVVTEPLNALLQKFLTYLPHALAGAALILVAWVVATLLRTVINAALNATSLDEKLHAAAGTQGRGPSLSKSIADTVYWIVFLVFLPAILGAFQMEALLAPVNAMMTKVFSFLPNLLAAAVTLLVGWFVAKVVQRIVSSLLASVGLNELGERWGLTGALGKNRLTDVLGLAVYFVILVPVLVSALDHLQLAAITRPATDMLGAILNKIPLILAATLILLIAFLVGRVVGGIVANLLAGLGFNAILVKLGLSKTAPADGPRTPANLVGTLIRIAILLVAVMAAAETLGYPQITLIIHDFVRFAGNVVLGLVIFSLGLMLAQVVAGALHTSDAPNARLLALAARAAIIVLAGAMALRATGVADSIVNLGFGAMVCGLALAAALAFGLGGRQTAAGLLAEWKDRRPE